MNLDDLKYFLSLARERTMSAAGKKLMVKHTTVARRVDSLEKQLGSRLFDRLREGYFLTQAGEDLYKHAIKIEQQSLEAQKEIMGHDALLKGALKLTVPNYILAGVIAPRLHEFTEKYPDIDLEVSSSPALFDLSNFEAHVAVRVTATPPENLVGRLICPMRHGIYAGEGYLKSERPHEKIIIPRTEPEIPKWAKDHFPDAKILLRTDGPTTVIEMLKNNMGIARLACHIGETIPGIKRFDIELPHSDWGIWILSHSDTRTTARVRVCKDFLASILKDKIDFMTGAQSDYAEFNSIG